MSIFTKILGGGVEKVANSIFNGIDGLVTTEQERNELINELEELKINDRINARQMYQSDSSLQKWFAIVFLAGYMLLIIGMMYFIFTLTQGSDDPKLPEWAVAFLSTIFGAMSTKVGTITDFLFGGSKTAEIQERRRRK